MMSDLRQRVPGHSLIDELLHQWDVGAIHLTERSDEVVIDDEAVSWYRGVIGERRVASLLAQLGEAWTVLHSVPVGSGSTDIDHVVIGPSGVFTINTKYSPGKDIWAAGVNLQVSGHGQRHIHNSIREVVRAAGALASATGLDVPVTGVIVFVDPSRIVLRERPGDGSHDIRVVSDRELLDTIRGTTMLLPQELERIVDAAVRPETWHQSPTASTIGDHIEREFVALEEAVGPQLAAPVSAPRPSGEARGHAASGATRRRPSRATAPSRRPQSRSRNRGRGRGRKRQSLLEAAVGVILFLAVAYFLSRPEGLAWVTSLFVR